MAQGGRWTDEGAWVLDGIDRHFLGYLLLIGSLTDLCKIIYHKSKIKLMRAKYRNLLPVPYGGRSMKGEREYVVWNDARTIGHGPILHPHLPRLGNIYLSW
jgi:hypothetical protein